MPGSKKRSSKKPISKKSSSKKANSKKASSKKPSSRHKIRFPGESASYRAAPRHVDMIWPVWSLFDVTPEGRGKWSPKLSY
jgi:predicted dithiol-disulfide oxidoreductase (DUF899 family)